MIGANWRQFGDDWRQLAPIYWRCAIGANLAPIGAYWRQLAPIIGANWRYRQLAMCTNQKFVLRSLIGANWRQLAPMAKLCKFSACFQKLTIANWRQWISPIGATYWRQLAPLALTSNISVLFPVLTIADWRQYLGMKVN